MNPLQHAFDFAKEIADDRARLKNVKVSKYEIEMAYLVGKELEIKNLKNKIRNHGKK